MKLSIRARGPWRGAAVVDLQGQAVGVAKHDIALPASRVERLIRMRSEPVSLASVADEARAQYYDREIVSVRVANADGSYDRARSIASKLVREFPEEKDGWSELGYAHWMLGDSNAALDAFGRVPRELVFINVVGAFLLLRVPSPPRSGLPPSRSWPSA